MTNATNEPEPTRSEAEVAAAADRRDTAALLADLADDDVAVRRHARNVLVLRGEDVLPVLLKKLSGGEFLVRWEVAKALGEMRLPASIPNLIEALEDEEADVRWLAAVALAGIGRESLDPLLHAVIERSDSPYIRQGAHHVLTIYRDRKLRDALMHVRDALGPMENGADVIPAAERALRALRTLPADATDKATG